VYLNVGPHFTESHLFFPMAQQPPVGQGLLIIEASRSQSFRHTTLGTTPLDEGSARRRDLYLTRHNTHNRQRSMPPGGIRTRNPSKLAAVDPRLRPCSHWDRHGISQEYKSYWIELHSKNVRKCVLITLRCISYTVHCPLSAVHFIQATFRQLCPLRFIRAVNE
jgi:hypothetical protein